MAAAGLRSRQVSSIALDHVGVVTRDLAALAAQYERLGFTLTPLARQADGRIGNRCAMLRQGVRGAARGGRSECQAVPRWNVSWHAMPASTSWRSPSRIRRPSSRGCAAPASSIRSSAQFDRAIDDAEPPALRARFALIQLPDQPEGRINLVRHLTPEVLWQERFLHHPNSAAALDGGGASPLRSRRTQQLGFRAWSDAPVLPDPAGGFALDLSRGRVRLLPPGAACCRSAAYCRPDCAHVRPERARSSACWRSSGIAHRLRRRCAGG